MDPATLEVARSSLLMAHAEALRELDRVWTFDVRIASQVVNEAQAQIHQLGDGRAQSSAARNLTTDMVEGLRDIREANRKRDLLIVQLNDFKDTFNQLIDQALARNDKFFIHCVSFVVYGYCLAIANYYNHL